MHVIIDIEQVLLVCLLGYIAGRGVRWALKRLFPKQCARL